MTTTFDQDVAVRQTSGGVYEAVIGDAWTIIGPNGGYLASLIQNAMFSEVNDPERTLRSLTTHYLRSPKVAPVEIEVTTERSGKTLSTLSARMTQDGETMALALGAFSKPWDGIDYSDTEMPTVPPPEEIEPFPKEAFPRHIQNFDLRHATGEMFFSSGDVALVGAWIRMSEPRVLDPLLLTTLTDSIPPAPFPKLDRPNPAPTIDLTIHHRSPIPADAAPGDWYLGVFRSTLSSEGFFEENGEIYTRTGILLAQSRQLALLRAFR